MADSIFSGVLSMPRSRTDVVLALVGGIGALAVLDCHTRVSRFLLGVRQAPPGVARALHYVPVAAFAGLIVPSLAVPDEIAPCLVAAFCTGVVAVCLGKPWSALLGFNPGQARDRVEARSGGRRARRRPETDRAPERRR